MTAAAGPTSLADALKASLAAVRGTPAQAGEIETEVKAAPRRAIAGDTKTRATAGRAGHATGGGTEQGRAGDGPARGGGAGTGRARTSGAGSGGAKASGAGTGGAKASGARASGARASRVEAGGAKGGTLGTPAAKSARRPAAKQPAKEAGADKTTAQPRSRRRAS